MFLRKLFNSENKIIWVLVDLLIVIIGVYCAFLIQEYASNQKTIKEKDQILAALKYELEFFRIQMPGRASFSENQANEWKEIYDAKSYYNISTWRFIEPQYNYQVIEHAINNRNSEIIDFELYQALQDLYVQIRRIEHSERMLTEAGTRYQSIPNSIEKGSPNYDIIWAKNYENFQRFVQYMFDRAGNQKLLGDESVGAIELVNARLDPESKRKIEETLILKYVDDLVNSEERAVIVVSGAFPDFTEEEIRQMYRKATGTVEASPADSTSSD